MKLSSYCAYGHNVQHLYDSMYLEKHNKGPQCAVVLL